MTKNYTLNITEDQAQLLTRALDLFTRIGIGQFEAILEVYDRGLRLPIETREQMRELLQAVKVHAGHPSNGSYGIHNPKVSDDFRAAFDILQVIRHRLAWDRNPEGGMQVNFDTPHHISKQPLATITSTPHEGS